MGAVGNDSARRPSEIEDLFDEWLRARENEILGILKTKGDPADIASALGISEKAMLSIIYRMARSGSIVITEIRPHKETGG